ncbi:MAG: PIN domain-containing protein [Nitrospirota bacterium]
MRRVFADTAYWIALTNPFDQHHDAAVQCSSSLGRARILTTDAVLIEFLNALAEKGPHIRGAAIRTVETILNNPLVTVLPQSRSSFIKGFSFYKARPDKGYSLTDCLSMTVLRDRKLSEVLTTDRHFEQEGFVALMISKARR